MSILFGPKHKQFPEAVELIQAGGAWEIPDGSALSDKLTWLLGDSGLRKQIKGINQVTFSSA